MSTNPNASTVICAHIFVHPSPSHIPSVFLFLFVRLTKQAHCLLLKKGRRILFNSLELTFALSLSSRMKCKRILTHRCKRRPKEQPKHFNFWPKLFHFFRRYQRPLVSACAGIVVIHTQILGCVCACVARMDQLLGIQLDECGTSWFQLLNLWMNVTIQRKSTELNNILLLSSTEWYK